MPLYDWRDNNTQKVVTIHRDFSKYEETPTKEEAVDLTDEEFSSAKWERIIGGGQKMIRGAGWGGAKGYW